MTPHLRTAERKLIMDSTAKEFGLLEGVIYCLTTPGTPCFRSWWTGSETRNFTSADMFSPSNTEYIKEEG